MFKQKFTLNPNAREFIPKGLHFNEILKKWEPILKSKQERAEGEQEEGDNESISSSSSSSNTLSPIDIKITTPEKKQRKKKKKKKKNKKKTSDGTQVKKNERYYKNPTRENIDINLLPFQPTLIKDGEKHFERLSSQLSLPKPKTKKERDNAKWEKHKRSNVKQRLEQKLLRLQEEKLKEYKERKTTNYGIQSRMNMENNSLTFEGRLRPVGEEEKMLVYDITICSHTIVSHMNGILLLIEDLLRMEKNDEVQKIKYHFDRVFLAFQCASSFINCPGATLFEYIKNVTILDSAVLATIKYVNEITESILQLKDEENKCLSEDEEYKDTLLSGRDIIIKALNWIGIILSKIIEKGLDLRSMEALLIKGYKECRDHLNHKDNICGKKEMCYRSRLNILYKCFYNK